MSERPEERRCVLKPLTQHEPSYPGALQPEGFSFCVIHSVLTMAGRCTQLRKLFSTSLSLPGVGGTSSPRQGGQGSGLLAWVGGGRWGPACPHPFRSAGGPLAKTWSSCRSPPAVAPGGGWAANQKQTDRPRDFLPAHQLLSLLVVVRLCRALAKVYRAQGAGPFGRR